MLRASIGNGAAVGLPAVQTTSPSSGARVGSGKVAVGSMKSLSGYEFQQVLIWHATNNCVPRSLLAFKPSWYPIFLYRRNGSKRRLISGDKAWDSERHTLDCHASAVPQTVYQNEDLKQHPCQKPVSVMNWMIYTLTNPGERVGSLFAGVAPCGVAAERLGRRYHGIETDPAYRRIGEARIAAYGRDR